MKNNAFTLIELLVVVLIIGILAAVALPQYTKTVERSRLAEAQANIGSIMDSLRRARLEERKGSAQDLLDIELSGGEWTTSETVGFSRKYKTKNFSYFIEDCEAGCNAVSVRVLVMRDDYKYILDIDNSVPANLWRTCWTLDTNLGRSVCKQLVGQNYDMVDDLY